MTKEISASLNKTLQSIKKAETIMIVCHVNPDGDTIGGVLALGLALTQLGKKVSMLSQDGVPTRFQFLPGSELIQSEYTQRADLAIAVDCGSDKQLGRLYPVFLKAKNSIQIDHHDFGHPFGKIQLFDGEAAAVGEIVYELIRALKADLTPAIATCLLTSIIVDTGSFRFSNLRPKTFDICSALIKKGVDLRYLMEEAYWKKSRSMAKLSGYCMMNVQFMKAGNIAWAIVYQKDFKRFGALLSDVDAVSDDLRSIEGVKVAALFRETPSKRYRVSLRSSHGLNVAQVAQNFGGGGHYNAAGCSIAGTAKERKRLLAELERLVS